VAAGVLAVAGVAGPFDVGVAPGAAGALAVGAATGAGWLTGFGGALWHAASRAAILKLAN
jgi:hypothetical protein